MADEILKQVNGGGQKRKPQAGGRAAKRRRAQKEPEVAKEGSTEEVLMKDIRELLAAHTIVDRMEADTDNPRETTTAELPARFSEINVKVLEISSTGDGLAQAAGSDHIYVVPFTAPGDIVRIKVIRSYPAQQYSVADFLSVVEPSPLRDDSRINCKYFSSCSGCQFQMLDYSEQLKHKRTIIERAYKNFSQLAPEHVPAIQHTMGSPLQYGYRTKLTPHFDGPPGYRSRELRRNGVHKSFESVPPIGFQQKGQRKTLDIEDCPIGTDAVRMGMKRERSRVATHIENYHKGATILLRESTERTPYTPDSITPSTESVPENTIINRTSTYTDTKICITDNNATSKEYIDDFVFTNPAGSFFQNNNSILPSFTQYIRDHILPQKSTSPPVKYLIDAYSGSGLFTITLASLFASSTGIDIAQPSIAFASKNAALNDIPPSKASFLAADAPELFKSVTYPADETVVVIDPPRKGCDESFLKQLLIFGPRRVVYVSCNVHTQARDVGVLVDTSLRTWDGEMGKKLRYKIESLRGFDFFPQTGHVEGVAVLSRVDEVDEVEQKNGTVVEAKVHGEGQGEVLEEAAAVEVAGPGMDGDVDKIMS